jgi:hypothetical protein
MDNRRRFSARQDGDVPFGGAHVGRDHRVVALAYWLAGHRLTAVAGPLGARFGFRPVRSGACPQSLTSCRNSSPTGATRPRRAFDGGTALLELPPGSDCDAGSGQEGAIDVEGGPTSNHGKKHWKGRLGRSEPALSPHSERALPQHSVPDDVPGAACSTWSHSAERPPATRTPR